jgi:hypothetical protein
MRRPRTIITQPYIGWEHPRECRSPRTAPISRKPEAAATFDIYILGGSVAQTFGQIGERPLARRLRKDPRFENRRIRVHDYALAAFKEPQLVMMLAYVLALGHEPDAVVVIDGFNEAALGWNNAILGTQPIYPHVLQWTRTVGATPSDASLLYAPLAVRAKPATRGLRAEVPRLRPLEGAASSTTRGSFVLEAARGLRRDVREPRRPDQNGPGPEHPWAGDRGGGSGGRRRDRPLLVRDVDLDQGLCSQRGIPYLHVLSRRCSTRARSR